MSRISYFVLLFGVTSLSTFSHLKVLSETYEVFNCVFLKNGLNKYNNYPIKIIKKFRQEKL